MRYRLSGTVEEAHLSSVIAAYSAAGVRSDYDPEITLSLMTKFNAAQAYEPRGAALVVHAVHPKPAPAKGRTTKHMTTKSNGGEWPAKGSIYDVVLEALKQEPKTPVQLRDVLKNRGFSVGSVNSALSRLLKASKAAPTGTGAWASTGA